MNPVIAELDPRVEELLRSIAKDPESRLLRVDRRSMRHELCVEPASVGVATPGLTAAERQLVDVHRLEVVDLLKQCVISRLAGRKDSPVAMSRYDSVRGQLEIATTEDLLTRAKAVQSLPEFDAGPVDLIDACLAGPAGSNPNTGAAVAAALRLIPRPDMRIMAGLSLLHDGAVVDALAQFGRAMPTNTQLQGCAWVDIGAAYQILGDVVHARDAYARATTIDPLRATAWLGRFTLSGILEDEVDLERVVRQLEELRQSQERHFEWYLAVLERRRAERNSYWRTEFVQSPRIQRLSDLSITTGRLFRGHIS